MELDQTKEVSNRNIFEMMCSTSDLPNFINSKDISYLETYARSMALYEVETDCIIDPHNADYDPDYFGWLIFDLEDECHQIVNNTYWTYDLDLKDWFERDTILFIEVDIQNRTFSFKLKRLHTNELIYSGKNLSLEFGIQNKITIHSERTPPSSKPNV